MSDTITVSLPNAMIQSIDDCCKVQGITRHELIRIATAKMLFEEIVQAKESHTVVLPDSDSHSQDNSKDSTYEIPLDKIISVQYTLTDGKIINIIREKKIQ